MLPFNIAMKFPFLLYGKIKLTSLKGKIVFNIPIEKYMCKFGRNLEFITISNKSELRIDGTLAVNGSFSFGNDFIIHIMKGGELMIGNNSYFGRRTQIICTKSIQIGESMRFGYESQIIDSNFHYTLNLENSTIHKIAKPVILGNFIWVGNRSTIMGGTKTNDYLIIASNSLLNKDYTLKAPMYSLVGGAPAELLRKNIVRIFNFRTEGKISAFFKENKEKNIAKFNEDLGMDLNEI